MAKHNKSKQHYSTQQAKPLPIVAILLFLLLAAAVIAGAFGWVRAGKFEEQLKALKPSTADNGGGLVVTPSETSKGMKLKPIPYSADGVEATSEDEAEYWVVTAETTNYNGKIETTCSFSGDDVYWGDEGHSTDVTDYISVTQIDGLSFRVQLLESFGRPIKITVFLSDNLEVSADVMCNYKQGKGYTFTVLERVFSYSNNDLAERIQRSTSGAKIYVEPDDYVTVNSGNLSEHTIGSYTIANTDTVNISYCMTVNEDWAEQTELIEYLFEDSFSGTITENSVDVEDYFDKAWIEKAAEKVGGTSEGFISELYNADKSDPAYTLTITINGKDFSFGVLFGDLNNLAPTLTLDKTEIIFNG